MGELPDKLYFKIGEVARLVGVKPYVLRYWETEFPSIRPGKTESKHRLYRHHDVEILLEIRRLLHDERYTIAGAKRRLRGAKAGGIKRAVGGGLELDQGGGPADEDIVELTEVADADDRGTHALAEGGDGQMDLPIADARFRRILLDLRRELEELRDLL